MRLLRSRKAELKEHLRRTQAPIRACCWLIAMAVCVRGSATVMAEPASGGPSNATVVVELSDGSRVVGVPVITALKLAASVGKMDIPLTAIAQAEFSADRETTEISLSNGDRLSGILDLASLRMDTAWGTVDIGIPLVRRLTNRGNANQWSVRQEFSTNCNPCSVWSYGWSAGRGEPFTLYRSAYHDGVGHGWNVDNEATVWSNHSRQPAGGVQPGEVSLHPGRNAEFSLVRWTAPRSCRIAIKGTFGAGDYGMMNVRVLHRSKELFGVPNARRDEPFFLDVTVNAGDTIDFVVEAGTGGYYNGNTPLDATISVK